MANTTTVRASGVCFPDLAVPVVIPALHAAAVSLISITGVLGNFFILVFIYTFCRSSLDRQPVTLFYGNLALADLMTSLFYQPLMVVSIVNNEFPFSGDVCRLVTIAFSMIPGVMTIFTQTAMALYSFVRTRNATRPSLRGSSKKKILTVCVLVWLLAVVVFLPWLVIPKEFPFEYDFRVNTCFVAVNPHHLTIIGFIIPSIIITFSYTYVFLATRSRLLKGQSKVSPLRNDVEDMINRARAIRQQKAAVKVAKNSLILCAAYYLCWLPIHIKQFLDHGCSFFSHTALHRFAVTSLFMNTTINTALYAWRNRNFPRGVLAILTCRIHKHKLQLAGALPRKAAPAEGDHAHQPNNSGTTNALPLTSTYIAEGYANVSRSRASMIRNTVQASSAECSGSHDTYRL
ncbi:kappa-type opioid receptor-like [Ptychodera flava]|uniref:kappa-type opioid receptor-like n=1 Tax=Ptychodera flava TaxID=63121 RepID=UPI00396A898B